MALPDDQDSESFGRRANHWIEIDEVVVSPANYWAASDMLAIALDQAAANLTPEERTKLEARTEPLDLADLTLELDDDACRSGGQVGFLLAEELAKRISRALRGDPMPGQEEVAEALVTIVQESPELRAIELGLVEVARKSAHGAVAGVYFCEVGGKSFVVKPPGRGGGDIREEFLANMLAAQLGVTTPGVALVPVDYRSIVGLQERGDTQRFHDDICAADFVLAMDRVKGTNLYELTTGEAQGYLTGEGSAAVLEQIGQLVVFDVLIGNSDRFPILGSAGNPGNLMFAEGKVVAIDNGGTLNPDPYVVSQLKQDVEGTKIPATVRDFLAKQTGVDPGPAGEAAIARGMRLMLKRLAAVEVETIRKIVDSIAKARKELNVRSLLEGFELFRDG